MYFVCPLIGANAELTLRGAGCRKEGVTCLADMDTGRKKLVMNSPYFYKMVAEKIGNNSAEYWKPYLRTHIIYNLSPLLSDEV